MVALASGCATTGTTSGETRADADSARTAAELKSAAKAESAKPPVASTAGNVSANAQIYTGTGVFLKQTPPAAEPAGPEEFSLNFEAVDIRDIVQSIMGGYLKESFTIHPQTAGTATIRLSRPIPKKDLIPILEMLLRQNGQVMVKEDGLYKIMPAQNGTRGTITPRVAGTTSQLPNGYSVQMIQLKYVGIRDMQRILEPYVTEAGSVRVDELRNLVILSGTQRELKHLMEIIDIFDVNFLAGYSVALFQLSSDVKLLSADLDKLFGNAANSPLAGIVRIIPIERMNGLLIVTTQPQYLEEAKKWIERIDKSGGASGGTRFNIYPVQHGKAEKLAQLLNEIYGKAGSLVSTPALAPGARPAVISTPPIPGQPAGAPPAQTVSFGGDGINVSKDVRIMADNDNNMLLIVASPADFEKIEGALKKLDIPTRQVLVEVTIAEVTLTDELKYGIDWFINARTGTSNGLTNSTTGTLNTSGGLPATPKGPLGAYTGGLQLVNMLGGDIRGLLQAFGNDGKVQVLASPKVMVLDNQKAQIKVGDKISVTTGNQTTGTTTGVIQTIQYLDTGVLLSVQPRINSGGRVTLDLNQEVSSASADAGAGGNPNVSTRSFQTSVTVGSGETLILAGLIQRTRVTGSRGLPLLSKIPIIGAALGQQSYKDVQTELVVLITPSVVNNSDEARGVTEELRRKLPSLEKFIPAASTAKFPVH